MGASAVTISDKADVEMLEILACLEAIAMAKDINVQSVRVASDCLNAVRSIQQGTLGTYALIVKEINDSSLGSTLSSSFMEGGVRM
jgi:ribonuclease HI